VEIACQLGFCYLWIDSLSIIQESRLDWEQESAVMDATYENAVIIIGAAASANYETGILNPRAYKTETFRKYGFLSLYPNAPPSGGLQPSTFRGDERLADVLYALPLAQQGWIFQERLLSQCVLHYAHRQIYFQCRTAHLSADRVPPWDFFALES
jgi:Heterokaryon incompatibility protein (HET)